MKNLSALIILVLAGCVVAQQKAPTVADVQLGECRQVDAEHIQAALNMENTLRIYADSARMYRDLLDSLSHKKGK